MDFDSIKIDKQYNVLGMDCADCALHVENKVKKIDGISDVKVNFITGEMKIFANRIIPDKQVIKAIKNAGYEVNTSKLEQTVLIIDEMDCQDEVRTIENELHKFPEIKKVKFNIVKREVHIEHENTVQEVQSIIRKIGFVSVVKDADKSFRNKQDRYYKRQLYFTIFSGCLLLLGIFSQYILQHSALSIFLLAAGIIIGGFRIAIKGFKEAKNLNAGMNLLMSIAVVGAIFIDEWVEAAMVVFLFALAQLLELRSMEKVRNSVNALINNTPKFANVWQNGLYVSKAVEDVQIGEKILVKPGEKIPIDGRVEFGESFVDQSIITGESLPVKISSGQKVYAGSINKNGAIEIIVEKIIGESTIAQIIHLVSEAQATKAPQQAYVDRFAQYYTPTVIAFAVIIAVVPPLVYSLPFSEWFYRALVLLVIACPCALVISTPITIVSGLTNAMKNGILIKGGIFLEKFSKLKSIVFDKTGTLTIGMPMVQKVYNFNGHSEEEIVKIAASGETKSEHPLGQAIVDYAQKLNIKLKQINSFSSIEGKGIQSEIQSKKYFIGSHKMFEEKGLCDNEVHNQLESIENENHTAVLIGSEKEIYGIISIADSLRPEAQQSISLLKKKGIKNIGLLTGDNRRTANAVANKLGIDYQKSELLPTQKVKEIKELRKKYELIGMVGDGINDAPALASSSIGIAMGVRGTDIVLETADITLLKDDLLKLPYLFSLSKRTLRIIKQNITIALGLKFIFFVLAVPGWATLWMAVFADMGASLIVIFNGLRALKS